MYKKKRTIIKEKKRSQNKRQPKAFITRRGYKGGKEKEDLTLCITGPVLNRFKRAGLGIILSIAKEKNKILQTMNIQGIRLFGFSVITLSTTAQNTIFVIIHEPHPQHPHISDILLNQNIILLDGLLYHSDFYVKWRFFSCQRI